MSLLTDRSRRVLEFNTVDDVPEPVKTYRWRTCNLEVIISGNLVASVRSMITHVPAMRPKCPIMTEVWMHASSLLILFCLMKFGNVGEAQITPHRILILYEVGTEYPGVNLIEQGLRAAFDTPHDKLEIYREYMETVLFPDLTEQERFREFYIRKYRHRKPDVIITVGPSPLKFMVETHQRAFPGIPIVFCLPAWVPSAPTLDSDFVGATNDLAPTETLETALHMRPDTKHVVVVGGTSYVDTQIESIVKEQLRPYESRFDISYLTNLTMADLLERLHHLPDQTIVLHTSLSRDARGTTFVAGTEGTSMVVAAANAPVFVLYESFLNHGEVGGKVFSHRQQGRIAGELALRILRGEKPQNIPKVNAGTIPMFDWRALKRWGMKEKDLPPGSIVLNRQPTFWELYKWYVIGSISLMLVEALLILGLAWQRARAKKAETELAFAYDRLRMAVESGKSVGWDLDVRTGRDHWFGDLQTMFGMPSDTFEGTMVDFRRRIHPDDRELVSQAFADARLNRKPYVADFRVLRDDQTVRWITARGEFYYAGNGEPIRMLGMATDVTDTKLLEQQVRESEQRFRLVANTAPMMIWTTGTDKLCNYVNQPWLDFTGRTNEQELSSGWAAGIHSEDVVNSLRTYIEAFDKREQFELEYRLRRRDGEYRWIFDRGVPRFSPDGSFAGYIGCCIDVTERKRAEEALSTMGRRLIEAHEQERTWIGRELHDDINQRLALLAVELDQCSKEGSTDPNSLDRFHHAQQRITEIATDIQALSHRLHSSKLDYLGLAIAAKSFCKELSEKAKVEIDFRHAELPHNLPKEVSLCLFRVMQEALQNAVKYSGVHTFQVDLRGTSDAIELTVADTGRGFEEQDTLSRQGIGLISMRERLQIVHGELKLQSKAGAGTTIWARVPLKTHEYRAMAG